MNGLDNEDAMSHIEWHFIASDDALLLVGSGLKQRETPDACAIVHAVASTLLA